MKYLPILILLLFSCHKEYEPNGSKYPYCFTDEHVISCRYCGDNNKLTVPPDNKPCEYWDVNEDGTVDIADVELMKMYKCE